MAAGGEGSAAFTDAPHTFSNAAKSIVDRDSKSFLYKVHSEIILKVYNEVLKQTKRTHYLLKG